MVKRRRRKSAGYSVPGRVVRASDVSEVAELIAGVERAEGDLDAAELALVWHLRTSVLASWADVGQALGISGEAARKRFAGRVV